MPLYRKILHAFSLPCLVVKPGKDHFHVVEVNEKYLEFTHLSRSELIGINAAEAFPNLQEQVIGLPGLLEASYREVIQTGTSSWLKDLRVHIPKPNTSELIAYSWDVENIPILDEEGKTDYVLSVVMKVVQTILDEPKKAGKSQAKERYLKGYQTKLEVLINHGTNLMWILDAEGNFNFISEASKDLLGKDPVELVGYNLVDFLHPEDEEILKVSLEYLSKKQQMDVPPIRILNAAGSWKWVEARATNLLDDPEVGGIIFNLRDVTQLLQQEREIHQLHERYALAVRATRDLIYDWDLQSDVRLRFYQDTQYLFGYAPEEVERKFFWHEHIHPEDKEQALKTLDAQLKDINSSYVESTYRIRKRNGRYANVVDKGYIIRDGEGKAIRLVGAMRDVTQLIAQKEALEVANERHNMAMKATNEMIWDWDLRTNEIERSASFPAVYGYSDAEAGTAGFWIDRVHPDDRERMESTLMAAINDEAINQWDSDYLVERADGKYRHVIDRAWISRNQDGKATRIVGATLDVTEMKKAYDRIQQQNKLLKEIAWDQSHLVRAPLSRLLGLMQYIEQVGSNCDLKSDVWLDMKRSASELDHIIRKIVKKSEDLDS